MTRYEKFVTGHLPIGYSREHESNILALSITAAVIISTVSFLVSYVPARADLFETAYNGSKYLISGTIMEDFADVLGSIPSIFLTFALICLIAQTYSHYAHHKNGSNAIYTMKRLADERELARRCVVLPLIEAAIILASAVVMIAVFYIIYMLATPDECIRAGQLAIAWAKWSIF